MSADVDELERLLGLVYGLPWVHSPGECEVQTGHGGLVADALDFPQGQLIVAAVNALPVLLAAKRLAEAVDAFVACDVDKHGLWDELEVRLDAYRAALAREGT